MNTIDLLKRRIDTYQNLIDRLDRMTSGNYMHTAASIRCTLNAMISNNQALLDDVTNFSANQDEPGDLELNEFENAILEILDFTSRSVLANNKMPKFRRLQQLSKEWSVNFLNVAKKIVEDEEEKQKKDVCEGCNNVKGCITCTNGSEWAHISEPDIESDCSMCVNYEGFGQCKEFGYNLIEHCKEYIKGEG